MIFCKGAVGRISPKKQAAAIMYSMLEWDIGLSLPVSFSIR